jgi:oxepin-CoA hydrolase/3-oxo-5,6-dehydrosuberyl-CoA semialdehyde dehydrogenase
MFVADVVRDLTQKAGQKCTAIRRVFVPEDALDDVREAMEDHLQVTQVGDPTTRGVRVGPVSTAAQHRDVAAGIAQLTSTFEHFVKFEGDIPDSGYFVRPQVFFTKLGVDAPWVHEHEVFGPVATVLSYNGSPEAASEMVNAGGGGLVVSVYANDVGWAAEVIAEIAPWHGRVYWGSKRVADQGVGPGTVMPGFVHGGPGKAGGGEELGGLRGLRFYQQRTAIQADRALFDRAFPRA